MPALGSLLGTFIYAGSMCLGTAGSTCFSHTLPATPDTVLWIGRAADAAFVCAPVNLVTRNSASVVLGNAGANSAGEGLVAVWHSEVR